MHVQYIFILVDTALIALYFETTGSMPLLVDQRSPRVITSLVLRLGFLFEIFGYECFLRGYGYGV
jgi:hypothetical protein